MRSIPDFDKDSLVTTTNRAAAFRPNPIPTPLVEVTRTFIAENEAQRRLIAQQAQQIALLQNENFALTASVDDLQKKVRAQGIENDSCLQTLYNLRKELQRLKLQEQASTQAQNENSNRSKSTYATSANPNALTSKLAPCIKQATDNPQPRKRTVSIII